jgi:4-amino-4-deoxy-L-arabinose transferase-like glycosyltransferase
VNTRPFRIRLSNAHVALIAVFALGFVLRVYFAATCDFMSNFSDMHDYNELAVEGGFNTYLPPLYPLFLRLIYSVFGSYNYKAVYIVQSIITSSIILLMYGTVRRIGNEIAALTAAAICAVYPNFIAYNLTTMTEAMSLFFLVLLLWLLFKPFDERKKAITLGCVLAAAAFVKSAMLFFVPGTILFSKKRLVLVLVLAVLLSPWIVRNAIVHDTVAPVSDTGALNFYATYNPAATGSRHVNAEDTPLRTYDHDQMTYVREALKFIINNKWQTIDITYNKVALLISRGWDTFILKGVIGDHLNLVQIMMYAYLPVAALGFIGLLRLYDRKNRIIAVMLVSYLFFSIMFAIFKFRYRVLAEPMLMMYASLLIGNVWELASPKKSSSSS